MATLYSAVQATPDASETVEGKLRISTNAEGLAGTDDATAMTPLKTANAIAASTSGVTGGLVYRGSYDASLQTPDLTTASKGDFYLVSVAGALDGVALSVGDHIVFNQNASSPVTSAMFDKIDSTDAVSSVNGQTGVVSLTAANVGALASGDNISELTNNAGYITSNLSASIAVDTDAAYDLGTESAGFDKIYGSLNGAVCFKASNASGAQILKGQPVYISGVSGDVPEVSLADADAAAMPSAGLAGETANAGAEVRIITFGNLEGVDTSAYNLGDTLYIDTTAGALTATAPAGESAKLQNIGKVIRVHATAGVIKVGGAGRSAATPNLNQDKIFLGDSNNRAVSTALSAVALSSFNNDLGLATVATSGAYGDLSGTPSLGTAAALDAGTSANNAVQLDGSARLPAVDGSQLTNLPSASAASETVAGVIEIATDAEATAATATNKALVPSNLGSIALTSLNDDLGSTYQALDAGLTSISGLTTSADQLIYTTASDTYATASLTAAGRALLDDADAAAQRATLGAIAELSDDSSPQLGGDLDLNGQDIVTASNADLDLAPHGTGVVVVRGNQTGGNNQGAIKLNCEQNSHGVTIKSPAHASGASYTLTLPVNDGDADQVLKTDGSGALAWVDQTAGQASSTVITASLTALAVGGEIYTIDPTASAKVYIPLVSNTNDVSNGDRIKVENLSAQTMQISSGRPLYTGVGELAPQSSIGGSELWSGNKYRVDLESRGTVELVYQGGNFYSSYYPAIETSVDSIAAGDLLGYSKVRNAIERAGDYILSADINGTIEALFTYATAYDESTARTITLPSPYTLETYCEALDGRRLKIENRGESTLSVENASSVYNNGIYYRTYLRNFDDTNAGNQTLQSGESLVVEFEYEVITNTTHHLYARIKKYGYFPTRVIESDTSATNTTLSTGTELEKVIYVENGSTAVTVTLPTISGVKDGYLLTIKALGSADVTVSRGGTDTIDGATNSLTLTQNQSVVLAKASGGWNIVQAIPASASVSAASETTAGIIEIATDAEAGAGSATDKALVPSNVSSLTLSPSQVTGLATVATSGAYSDLSGTPTLGTAAALDVGTSASNVVQLDGSARLPAVDGSQLTNLPSAPVSSVNSLTGAVVLSANDLAADHTAGSYTPTNANVDGHLAGIDTALASAGGGGFSYSAVSTATTAQADYHYSVTGTTTITLPAATGVTAGQEVRVKNMGTDTVTVSRSSTDTIDGQTSITMAVQYQALDFISNGSNGWEII